MFSRTPAGRDRDAFTLIELLVVTFILGVVITVIGAALAGGIRAWDTSRSFNVAEGQAHLGLVVFERDVLNTFPFFGVGFDGESQSVSFPCLVRDEGGARSVIGTVQYALAGPGPSLYRTAWSYPSPPPDVQTGEPLIEGVQRVAFEYYTLPGGKAHEGRWVSQTTNFPSAVRITLSLTDDTTDKERTVNMEKTVVLMMEPPE